MGFAESAAGILFSTFEGMSDGLDSLKIVVSAILDANYAAVTKILTFLWNLGVTAMAVAELVALFMYTVATCVIDFLTELFHFFIGFLNLVWKLIVLLYSLLDLLFHLTESLFYFIWTGGQWTAQTIQISSRNLTENGISTWKYFVLSLKELTDSLIGGFTSIGILTKELFHWTLSVFTNCYVHFMSVVHYIDSLVRDFAVSVFDYTYHFLTDYIMKLPREAYLGIVIFCSSIFIIKGIFHFLCNRGLTFPIYRNFQTEMAEDESEDYDDYDGRMAEFSDDDLVDLTLDGDDDVSQMSDTSDDDEDDVSDEDGELEVDSSDDESVAPSESEMSEINIVLPEMEGLNRRSTTPARFSKEMTADDLQRVIDDEKEKRMCVVCQDHSKSVLILPCRHMCLCVNCGNQIARSRMRNRRVCPLCRTRIRTIMNVYM